MEPQGGTVVFYNAKKNILPFPLSAEGCLFVSPSSVSFSQVPLRMHASP